MTLRQENLGCGVWRTSGDGRPTVIEIRDVPAYRAAIGDGFAVGFAQLFTVADRIDCFVYLMGLVTRRLPPVDPAFPETAHDPDSIAADRARMQIVVSIWGVLHEAYDAVITLHGAGLTDVLEKHGDRVTLDSWQKVQEIAKRWQGGLKKNIRNELAFHLGFKSSHEKGLKNWPADKPLTISTADGVSRANVRWHMGFDLVACGLGIQTSDIEELADQGLKDHEFLPGYVIELYLGFLTARGAVIPPIRRSEP